MSKKGRQKIYAEQMEEEGFTSVRTWIPKEKKDELKRITKAWRDAKRKQQG